MSVVGTKTLGGINELVALAIGLAVISVISGLSILAGGTSAGLISAIAEITAFRKRVSGQMGLIGLGVAVALLHRTGLF